MTKRISKSLLGSVPLLTLTISASALLMSGLMSGCATNGGFQTQSENGSNAKTKKESADELFSVLDTNHDGFVSKEEMKRAMDMFSEEGRMESTEMVYGLRKKTLTPTDRLKHLSAAEKKRLIARAFARQNSQAAAADQERLSQEDFRKIVIGPQTSIDSKDQGEAEDAESEPNPWLKLM